MEKFKFIYYMSPIDFWENAIIPSDIETARVLKQMPEEPRTQDVYKLYFPTEISLTPIYLCKAENNGTVYIFSDYNLKSWCEWLEECN